LRTPAWILAALLAVVVTGVSPAVTAGVSKAGVAAPAILVAATGGGCGKTVQAGSKTFALDFGGRTRTVIVHVPTGYTGKAKVPLVLNMHGSGSTSFEQELFSGMDAESDTAGFIVAYPQALIPSGTGFDWHIPGVPLRNGVTEPKNPPDDVAFLTELVSALEAHYCVNLSHVYAMGFSGGARITSQLACDDSNIFAAVAAVSGLRHPTPCPTVRAVPVIAFHGTADPVDPYQGHGQPYWTESVPQAAKDWAAQNTCSTRALNSRPVPGEILTIYAACPAHAAVELYTLVGEGHEWPGGPLLPRRVTRGLGPQSNVVNADAVIWGFFSDRRV